MGDSLFLQFGVKGIPSDQLRCLKQQTALLLELEDAAIEKLIAKGSLVQILDESSSNQGN